MCSQIKIAVAVNSLECFRFAWSLSFESHVKYTHTHTHTLTRCIFTHACTGNEGKSAKKRCCKRLLEQRYQKDVQTRKKVDRTNAAETTFEDMNDFVITLVVVWVFSRLIWTTFCWRLCHGLEMRNAFSTSGLAGCVCLRARSSNSSYHLLLVWIFCHRIESNFYIFGEFITCRRLIHGFHGALLLLLLLLPPQWFRVGGKGTGAFW